MTRKIHTYVQQRVEKGGGARFDARWGERNKSLDKNLAKNLICYCSFFPRRKVINAFVTFMAAEINYHMRN